MANTYDSGMEQRVTTALESLRTLYRSCSDDSLKSLIKEVASTLDECEGDRQYLRSELLKDEQTEWRELMLSYKA